MRVVIIGASFAGLNLARNLPRSFTKSVICLDKYPYKKSLLMDFLVGNIKSRQLLFEDNFFNIENTEYFFARKASRINTKKKNLVLDDKAQVDYDVLVIATGSRPRYISCPGVHKRGVVSLSVLEDVKYIKDIVDITSHTILYLNTAIGFSALDMFSSRKDSFKIIIPERARLDKIRESLSGDLAAKMEGFNCIYDEDVKEIIGNGDVKAIRLINGKIVACDLFIADTGIKPNLEVVKNTDISYEDAVLVNDNFRTNTEDVFALGDVKNQDLINLVDYRGLTASIEEESHQLAQMIKDQYSS